MKFIFVTREGYRQPGARIRSYGFSDQLRMRGLDTGVLSFADNFGAKAGDNEADFSVWEKTLMAGRGFKHLIDNDRPVFIINRLNYHAIPGILASRVKEAPFIFDADDWEARDDTGSYLGIFPKSRAERLMRFAAGKSRACIAASHYLREYLSGFNKNVYYIPTGVDLSKFRFKKREPRERIVFSWHGSVNRPEIADHVAFLTDCFRALREKYDHIELVIRGDGIFGAGLKNMLKRENTPGVKYMGWLEPDDMPPCLEEADIGLVPLFRHTKFNLSKSPVKLLEYMAAGRPVVASPVGEAAFIVENNTSGLLASGRDEFIHSMERLVEEPSEIDRLGANARKSVEDNYSLESMGGRLFNMILDNFTPPL